jgi:Sec-independent protein secretion pathway component TatC
MYLLYEGGILMARLLVKMRRETSDGKEIEAS